MHRRAGRGGGHRGSAVKRRRGDKRPRGPAHGMIAAALPAAEDQEKPWLARQIKAGRGVSDVLAARPPVTVRDSAFTAARPPRSLVTYNIRS
jgi:hypothetical protein